MTLRIAIQPDEVVQHNGERQSFSRRWTELAQRRGIEPVTVDVFAPDVLARIAACDAFLWRCDPSAYPRLYARRLLYAIEAGMDMPVFPSLQSCWHFEDKVGQYYFLAAAGVPTPATWVCWSREQAEQFCATANWPLVAKLAIGYQSSNVRLVRNREEALYYVDRLFGSGVTSLGYRPASRPRRWLRRMRAATAVARGRYPNGPTREAELQHGYFLVQEFLPDNDHDVRVTIIGNRAFAFRRFNRPGDFRASGSGRIDWDPRPIEADAIRLAWLVSHKTNAQTVAVDILRRGGQPVVVELTLSYAGWAVRDCPGHWILHGEPATGSMQWVDGAMDPADAILSDFLGRLGRTWEATA